MPVGRRQRISLVGVLAAGRLVRVALAAQRQPFRQTPIHDLDLAEGPDHDVERLQVAVDHPLAVGVGHGLAHLLENLQEPGEVVSGVGPFLQELRQGLAADQFHGEERPAVRQCAEIVDGHDARMLQLAGDPGFRLKAR